MKTIDALLNGRGHYVGKAYFFRAGQYVRYDWATERVDDGYPQPLSAWSLTGKLANGIDATLTGEGKYTGKAYFFRGDRYVRYDWASDRLDGGYPQTLSLWNLPDEFASGIDAALNGEGAYTGKAYFFKGDRYVRYDWTTERIDEAYPQPLSAWNLPDEFASGIDAALNGEGVYAGKAYFFKGDRYVRYDWAANRVDNGYPQSITLWKGIEKL